MGTGPELVTFAQRVSAAHDLPAARKTIVALTAHLLDTPWVAFTQHHRASRVRFVESCGDVVQRIARISDLTRQGVAWELAAVDLVSAPDLATEHRWPEYRRFVLAESPVRSALGMRLPSDAEPNEAIIVYADRAGHFDAHLDNAAEFAQLAALTLEHAKARLRIAHLEVALRTNREIGMAIGILMNRFRITEEAAFDMLRDASQTQHAKLREIAGEVVLTGALPSHPAP